MTVTYPHDHPLSHDARPETVREEPFVPVYARDRRSTRRRKGGVKTWMILAPIGVVVLGAGAAAMMTGGREDASVPLIEPAATAPVVPPQPLASEAASLEAPVLETRVATPVVEAAPAPVVRRTAPAPVRRAAPVRAAAPAPAPAERAEVAVEPAGPRAYTATLNAESTTGAAGAPTPVIVIQPAD